MDGWKSSHLDHLLCVYSKQCIATIQIYPKQTHLDESICLQAFGVLHSDFKAIGCSAEDGMVFEGDRFQYVGQVTSVIQTGHKNILLIISL